MTSCNDSVATVVNCTFLGNCASREGGGIDNDAGSRLEMTNCIVQANAAPVGPQIHGGTNIVTYSDVQDGWQGDGNIDCDPQFVRAPDPGPDGEWGTEDDDYGDLHLSAGSCCIDAGDTTVVLALGLFGDLDGYARVVDDPLTPDTGVPSGLLNDVVDMGAYEYRYRIPGDVDGDGDVDESDLGILLANWGTGCP